MDPLIPVNVDALTEAMNTVAHKRGLLETIPESVSIGKVMARVVVLLGGTTHKGVAGSASVKFLRTSMMTRQDDVRAGTVDQVVETLCKKCMVVKVIPHGECVVATLTEFGWSAVPLCTLMERASGWRKNHG